MIYTSNYKRKGDEYNAIAISAKSPEDYFGKTFMLLAPTWELIMGYKHGEIRPCDYANQYINLLETRDLTPQSILDTLPHSCYLLCYEPPGEFCHRHVLASWLNEHTDANIKEWYSDKELMIQQGRYLEYQRIVEAFDLDENSLPELDI